MNNQKNIDKKIAGIVQSVETGIPDALEEQLQAAAETIHPIHRIRIKRLPLFVGILSSAAVVLAALLFLFPVFQGKPEPRITEIYTEFEIIDKNIKIIFIQSHDFNLFEEEIE
jgi:hypothetical protein